VVTAATSAPAACASRPQRLDRSAPTAASSARSAAATDSFRVVRMRSRSRFSTSRLRASLEARSNSERLPPYQVPHTTYKLRVILTSSTAAPVVIIGPSRVLPKVLESKKRSNRRRTVINTAHTNCRSRQNASAAAPPTWAPRQRARCSRASSERAWGQGRISLA